MGSMNLDDIPNGSLCVVDTNVLLYAEQDLSAQSKRLLRRMSTGEVLGLLPQPVWLELAHKLMLAEAMMLGKISGPNPAKKLAGQPDVVRGLGLYRDKVRALLSLGIGFEPCTREDFLETAFAFQEVWAPRHRLCRPGRGAPDEGRCPRHGRPRLREGHGASHRHADGRASVTPEARVPRAIEVGFPIVEINRLAVPERNSFKPIYQMHKWFARRASCVFRGILLGALKPAYGPDGTLTDLMAEFYKDHTHDPDTAGSSGSLHGGGTTVVEALRLGCRVIGIDLNPVAWFIVKTEVEPVDLAELQAAFQRLSERPVAGKCREASQGESSGPVQDGG